MWTSIFSIIGTIYIEWTKICTIYRKILFKEINKTPISTLHFINTLWLHLWYIYIYSIVHIVKYCHSLFFTDGIAFTCIAFKDCFRRIVATQHEQHVCILFRALFSSLLLSGLFKLKNELRIDQIQKVK